MKICKELIDIAADAGCDAVKFQKRTVDKVYTATFLAEPRESPWGTTQREQKEGLEFAFVTGEDTPHCTFYGKTIRGRYGGLWCKG